MENETTFFPHVAVLMAAYNGEKYIRQQIDSILAQKNVRISLFIRDDGSTDQTQKIIDEYAKTDQRVFRVISVAGQLNVTKNFFTIVRSVDLETVDYIGYSDQDDTWLDNKMYAAITAIQQNAVNCYASNLLCGDASGNIIRSSPVSRIVQYLFNYKSNNQLPWDHYFEAASAGCTLVLDKQAALYFQGRLNDIYDRIPADASHDWSTYAITRIGGQKWFIDSNAYIIYRQHASNAYGTNAGTKGIGKLFTLFSSGWYRKHILMIDELYNDTKDHPGFMKEIRAYDHGSFFSRFRLAVAVSRYRRKAVHRIFLFSLILFGYFR
jgi:rhamnosyltransferase